MHKRRFLSWLALSGALGVTMRSQAAGVDPMHFGSVGTFQRAREELEELRHRSVVRIAMITNETGRSSAIGRQEAFAARAAVKKVNEAGGVLGRQLHLTVWDARSRSSDAVRLMSMLLQNKDDFAAIIGPGESSQSAALIPMAARENFPYISPSALNPGLCFDEQGRLMRNVFRLNTDGATMGSAAGRWAVSQDRFYRASAIVCDTESSENYFGRAFEDEFVDLINREMVWIRYPNYALSLWAELSLVDGQKPDLVLLPARQSMLLLGLLQYYDRKIEADLLVWDELYKFPYFGDAKSLLPRISCMSGINRDDPALFDWIGEMVRVGEAEGRRFASDDAAFACTVGLAAYMGVMLIADSLKRAQTAETTALLEAMSTARGIPWPGVGELTINPIHEPENMSVYFYRGDRPRRTSPEGVIDVTYEPRAKPPYTIADTPLDADYLDFLRQEQNVRGHP